MLATLRNNPNIRMIKRLLRDSRINPTDQDNRALKEITNAKVINEIVLRELLKDERVIKGIVNISDYPIRVQSRLLKLTIPKKINNF
jgi:hypothetical protein